MGAVDKDLTQADKEFETATQEKILLLNLVIVSNRYLPSWSSQVISLNRRLPAGLQQSVSSMINRIPEDPENTKVSLSSRMVNVVGFINEVNKFNGSISVSSELRQNESGAGAPSQSALRRIGSGLLLQP